MKKMILGLALVGMTFACKTDKNAAIADPSSANMPKAECCETKKAECSDKAKAECSKDAAKVCPVTGKAEG
ncbi:MAG: hypothetical protein ACKVWV_06840 [Planctomycetota bacterium]